MVPERDVRESRGVAWRGVAESSHSDQYYNIS